MDGLAYVGVAWDEPDEHGGNRHCFITQDEAINRARAVADAEGYVYKTAQAALEDFLTVHWAWEFDWVTWA
jgi:hypothetical protein